MVMEDSLSTAWEPEADENEPWLTRTRADLKALKMSTLEWRMRLRASKMYSPRRKRPPLTKLQRWGRFMLWCARVITTLWVLTGCTAALLGAIMWDLHRDYITWLYVMGVYAADFALAYWADDLRKRSKHALTYKHPKHNLVIDPLRVTVRVFSQGRQFTFVEKVA